MIHVMIDLETLGKAPGCAVRSIGAAVFDPRGDGVGSTFYRNIQQMSCWLVGLAADAGTIEWWGRQSAAAQEVFKKDPVPLRQAAVEFHRWFSLAGGVYVWCQGASFDEPIWQAAARAAGIEPPWKFWDVRCTRTIYHAADLDPRTVPRPPGAVAHHALDDVVYQVACVQEAFRRLPPKNLFTQEENGDTRVNSSPPREPTGDGSAAEERR